MQTALTGLGVLVLLAAALFMYWTVSVRGHRRRLEQLDTRIHVNGIRGKSTVTRLIAGVTREGGYVTVAKTTGSAARVIGPLGHEQRIRRRGAATINEQIDIVAEHVGPAVEALVIECMAVRPIYQRYSQEHMVRSDITVITNVRLDHQEEMGETLLDIADSLANTVPHNGLLITAEDRPELRARLAEHAHRRGSRIIYANPADVTDADMRGFDYLQFKDNVAIGLEVAKELGIPRHLAIEGMWSSVPDVGVVRLKTYDVRGRRVLWIPMFAANDQESVVLTLNTLSAQFPPGATVVGVLNNRTDRGRRAELFAHMVPETIGHHFDHIITLGAYEDTVTRIMTEGGYDRSHIHNLGETRSPTRDELLDAIAALAAGPDLVLIGMVNIHTHQAEMLIDYFEEADGASHIDEIEESCQPERAPHAVRHHRRAIAAHAPGLLRLPLTRDGNDA